MSRSYWNVSPAFWGDEKSMAWSDDAKLLSLYLLTCQHRTLEGLFRLPKGYIQEDLGWSTKRLAKPFDELLRDGFIEYDEDARLCLIVNALEYGTPDNPNQLTAAMRMLDDLPKSALFARLLEQAERFCEPLAQRLRERFPEGFDKPYAKPPTPTPTPTPTQYTSDARTVFVYWQERLGHPGAKFSDERKAKIVARLKDGMTVERLCAAIDGCAGSPYHMGENDSGTIYDSIELIFRNVSKVEEFAGKAGRKPGEKPPDPRARSERIRRAAEQLAADPHVARAMVNDKEEWEEAQQMAKGAA